MNLPAIANKIAKRIKPIIVITLKVLDIFFDEILLMYFKRK